MPSHLVDAFEQKIYVGDLVSYSHPMWLRQTVGIVISFGGSDTRPVIQLQCYDKVGEKIIPHSATVRNIEQVAKVTPEAFEEMDAELLQKLQEISSRHGQK